MFPKPPIPKRASLLRCTSPPPKPKGRFADYPYGVISKENLLNLNGSAVGAVAPERGSVTDSRGVRIVLHAPLDFNLDAVAKALGRKGSAAHAAGSVSSVALENDKPLSSKRKA
jgi:hypothetical protein